MDQMTNNEVRTLVLAIIQILQDNEVAEPVVAKVKKLADALIER